MKISKKVISNLTKCYSIAPLRYNDKDCILVAAEKHDPCYLFDDNGNQIDTVWTEPGGVMTMVQVPNTNGTFLATHKFYSPNDSKEAKIVVATPVSKGNWEIRTLVDLPHVHRFDIVERNGVKYLIACALKSGHEFKEDWSMAGKVYAAVLPDDLSVYNENNQLELKVIKDDMLKNHGYYKIYRDGVAHCIISCDSGVYDFVPPEQIDKEWSIQKLLDEPASDAVVLDIDEDGQDEIIMISKFHGDSIYFFKKIDGKYNKVYTYDNADFAHAMYGGKFAGKTAFIIGHRKGERNLLMFTFDKQKAQYEVEILDKDCGSANVYKFERNGEEILISTNREIDEVAMYKVEK